MSQRRSPSATLVSFGVATLVGGTLAGIAPGCLTDPDKCTIILSRNTPGGTLGFLTAPVAARGAAAITFTITSTNGADTSTVNWIALPKNTGLGASTTFVNNASLRRPPSGKFLARGVATLVGGTKTVTPGLEFTSNAKIFVCAKTFGGTAGKLSAPVASVNPTAGTFVINSNSGTDTSDVNWLIVDELPRFPNSGPVIGQSKGTLSGTTQFTSMNPMLDAQSFAAASVITSSAPANLAAFVSLTDGSVSISNDGSDVSLVEVLCL